MNGTTFDQSMDDILMLPRYGSDLIKFRDQRLMIFFISEFQTYGKNKRKHWQLSLWMDAIGSLVIEPMYHVA